MGNFYTNVVLVDPDLERVTSAVEALGRRAYVAPAGAVTVVYDERADEQDLEELRRLAGELSRRLGCSAFAICNHDDDVLWYALAQQGAIVDEYESFPGYFEGGSDIPVGGDAARLCTAFGVDDQQSAVDALLRKRHQEVRMEVERHHQLCLLLQLPPELALLGYGYVSRGELDEAGVRPRAVGGAPTPEEAPAAPPAPAIEPAVLQAMQAEAGDMVAHSAALAFARVEVPEPFAPLAGRGSSSGYAVLTRIQRYILHNGLAAAPGMVHADEALAGLLGERDFPFVALPRLLCRAFAVPPLSAEDAAALRAGEASFYLRFHEAVRRSAREALDPDQ